MVKAILFDLGGVLFSDGTQDFIDHIGHAFGVDKARASELLNGDLGSRYREGKITRHEFWTTFRQGLGLRASEGDLSRSWASSYQLNEGTNALIQDLSSRYDIYYLSDNVQERVDFIESRYHFLRLFKDGVFSHVVGVRKPNREIYEIALTKIAAAADEVIFIDDKASALEPARELGMKTVLFKDLAYVKRELARLGVRTSPQGSSRTANNRPR